MLDKVKSTGSRSSVGFYQSSRSKWDVLRGEDSALPLIEAIKSDDPSVLRDMLPQAQWYEIAVDEPLTIFSVNSSKKGEVSAMPLLTLARLVILAGTDVRAEALTTLYAFAKEQAIDLSSIRTRWAVEGTIKSHNRAAVEAMLTADPDTFTAATVHVPLLRLAMKEQDDAMVELLKRHGVES